MRKHVEVLDGVVLLRHTLRNELVSYVRDGDSVHNCLMNSCRGSSNAFLYNAEQFPGNVFANRIPPAHAGFVDSEIQYLVE